MTIKNLVIDKIIIITIIQYIPPLHTLDQMLVICTPPNDWGFDHLWLTMFLQDLFLYCVSHSWIQESRC